MEITINLPEVVWILAHKRVFSILSFVNMAYTKTLEFAAAAHGYYYYYRNFWSLQPNQHPPMLQ